MGLGKTVNHKWIRFLGFLCVLPILSACASGHCRSRDSARTKTVFVYKADGTKQCGIGSATSLQQAAQELTDVKIISQENKSDGKLYPMVCGAPTGKVNAFEIPESDLSKATAVGFKEFKK